MNTIITLVDFDEVSKTRAEFGIDLASRVGSKIIFSHAHNIIYAPATVAHMSSISNLGMPSAVTQQKLMEDRLSDFVDNLYGLSSVEYENHMGIGSVEGVTCSFTDNENADLIIIGATGKTSMEKFLLGRTDEKLSRIASCSVLVLPEVKEIKVLQNITLALDTQWFENDVAMDMLFELVKVYGAKLDIVHISTDDDKLQMEKHLLEKHGKNLNNLNYAFHIVCDDNIENGLTSFVSQRNCDMLVIIYRGHGFFKRLFDPGIRKEMISQVEIPLLILK